MFWWILTIKFSTLCNSADRPITVVYKKLHLQNISVTLLWKLMKQTIKTSRAKTLMARILTWSSQHVNRCLYCTLWLIENWRRPRKNTHKIALSCRFGAGIQCFCLWIYRLPCQYSFSGNPTTMQTWICWKPKFMKFFSLNQKVYTKVKNEEPTYYSKTSHIKSSQFASGSIAEGTVERSVVSRRHWLFIKVQRSAVFSPWLDSWKCNVEHAILDKGVEVAAGVIDSWDRRSTVVVKKGTIVTGDIV